MTRLPLVLVCCCPFLAHAQANAAKGSTLIAASEHPPILLPSASSTPLSRAPQPISERAAAPRIVAPKLIHRISIYEDGNLHVHLEGRKRTVIVELKVNELGQPTDLQISQPVEDALDVEVLATVGRFRYEPGTLNGKAFPMTVTIQYVVPVGTVY